MAIEDSMSVRELFNSPLADQTRAMNDRLRDAVADEESASFCGCCGKPVGNCNCGDCE